MNNKQPIYIKIDNNITLRKYYPYYKKTIIWYQDEMLCKQVDNIDIVYDLERLKKMYKHLVISGECYYIKFKNKIVGDITLFNNQEIAIVIDPLYQNKHIGRKAIIGLIKRAKEKNMNKVIANIYPFNRQSINAFLAIGFTHIDKDLYEYIL